MPNTIDDEFFRQRNTAGRAEERSRLDLPITSAVFLCVAQLEEGKGILELVSAYARLPSDQRERVILALAGEGSLREAVRLQAEQIPGGDVRILGHLDRSLLRRWLAAADAFILPTKRDNNPLSVIEAAFAGLPLLVSRLAGNADDLVLDGESGYQIDRPEPECIAAVMTRFLGVEESWGAMGKRSLEIADAGFRRTAVAQQFAAELAAL